MRIAVIADVHGNLPALECVLADIAKRDVDRIINLGDCASGPLWPRACVERLAQPEFLTIRGNHDRWASGADPASMFRLDRFAFEEMSETHRTWLRSLPVTANVAESIIAFHAAPDDDNRYFIEEVYRGRLVRAPFGAIVQRVADQSDRLGACRIMLCAHSHLSHVISLPGGRLIINPGSVGCPAYLDPDDEPHVSESGAPHARYAVVRVHDGAVSVEQVALPYNFEAAARQAERHGSPGWAHALRTGFMPMPRLDGEPED